jgi:hypothetical protein
MRSSRYNLLLLQLYSIALFSCGLVKVSKFENNNKIETNYFQNYTNDSLQISIDFTGAHIYKKNSGSKAVIPKYNRLLLKKFKLVNRAELVFESVSSLNYFGYEYFGYIISKELKSGLKNFHAINKNDSHTIYASDSVFVFKNKIAICYLLPLKTGSVFFICSRIRHKDLDFKSDSLVLLSNTQNEFSSLLQGAHFLNDKKQKQNLLSSILKINALNNCIEAINKLKSIPLDSVAKYNLQPYYYQTLLTQISFLDNMDSLKITFDLYRRFLNKSSTNNHRTSNNVTIGGNALQKVEALAGTHKVLMINEAHYDFTHRAFVRLLLERLFKMGYRHLCLEDKAYNTSNVSDFPSKLDGFYVKEPQMAELIRAAKRVGYTIHAYEDTITASVQPFHSPIDQREYYQAYNLYNQYKTDTVNKWIVLSGYDHINKTAFTEGHKSMLQNFIALSGTTPLSVNQSYFSTITNISSIGNSFEKGYYWIDYSHEIYKENQSDLYIINNTSSSFHDIDGANNYNKYRSYNLNTPKHLANGAYLLIYYKEEYDKLNEFSIPVYISALHKNPVKPIMLYENEYLEVITDSLGKVIGQYPIKLNK